MGWWPGQGCARWRLLCLWRRVQRLRLVTCRTRLGSRQKGSRAASQPGTAQHRHWGPLSMRSSFNFSCLWPLRNKKSQKKYFFVLYLYDEGAAWKGNYFSCSVFTCTLWVDLRALVLLKSFCRSVAVLESSLLALHPPHAVSFSSPFRTPIRVVAQRDGPQSPDTGREGSSKWSALSFPCCAQNSPRRSRNLYLLLSSVNFPLSLPQPFLFQSTSWGLKLCWAAASLWECPAWLELLTRVPK